MEWKAVGVIMMILTALIPLGLSSDEPEVSGLMKTLEGAHLLAEEWITPLKDELPADSPILKDYSLAEEYRTKALDAFSNGDEVAAREYALKALHSYRLALEGVKESGETYNASAERVKAGLERLNAYFTRAEELIRSAKRGGLDTSDAEKLLRETRDSYSQALHELKEGNVEGARKKFEEAESKRRELDSVLKELQERSLKEREHDFVKAFLVKTERGLWAARTYLEAAKNRGLDVSRAEERLAKVEGAYLAVKTLAEEGRWDEALRAMKKNAPIFTAFFEELRRVEHIMDGKSFPNVQSFQENLGERVRKDTLALEALKRRGVNTVPAEIVLRNAVMELQTGRELLKRGEPEKAREHFLRALALLKRVEAFIGEKS